jgi:hypothetical protein
VFPGIRFLEVSGDISILTSCGGIPSLDCLTSKRKTQMKTTTSRFGSYKSSLAISLATLILSGGTYHGFSQDNGVNVGLIYPISTRGSQALTFSNSFSLNAIAGLSREEKAFTVAGFSNIIKEDARGFQAAGFSNHIGGFSEGFKAAGFVNTYSDAKGFQAAGFANVTKGTINGMQAAGFLNVSGDIKGFQAAGYINVADDVNGTQGAGFINIAGDVEGTQLAGFINIAKKVKGAQVAGFINIADSSEYPIGIVNLIKDGERSIGVSTDDNLTTLLSFRSGSRKLYGIIGIGSNLKNSREVFSMQFGLGAHLISKNKYRLNGEFTTISLENFRRGGFTKYSVSMLPAFRLAPGLEVFGGPALNYVNTSTAEGKTLIKHYIWSGTNDDHLNGLYIGYTAGLHLRL